MKRTDLIALADLAVRRDPAAIARLVDFARQIAESQPVATVHIHRTGGNAGIAWSAIRTDEAPLMRDGEPLYTLPLED